MSGVVATFCALFRVCVCALFRVIPFIVKGTLTHPQATVVHQKVLMILPANQLPASSRRGVYLYDPQEERQATVVHQKVLMNLPANHTTREDTPRGHIYMTLKKDHQVDNCYPPSMSPFMASCMVSTDID